MLYEYCPGGNNLIKSEIRRKKSLQSGETAASALLKLFTNDNERCHATDELKAIPFYLKEVTKKETPDLSLFAVR